MRHSGAFSHVLYQQDADEWTIRISKKRNQLLSPYYKGWLESPITFPAKAPATPRLFVQQQADLYVPIGNDTGSLTS